MFASADPLTALRDQNAALQSELDQARDEQAATREILRIISAMGPGSRLEPVLTEIVATAARLCAAEYALAYVLKEDGRYHTIAANRADAALVRYAVEHPLLPARGSLIGRAALEKRPVHVEDCLKDPEYAFPEFQRIGRFRTMLGVPLLRDQVVVGALGLLRSVVAPFSVREIELVSTFADHAVIAIENVRLFEALQARTCELQESLEYQTATSEVLEVMSQSPTDAEPVFKAIVQSAARLCGAVLSNVQLYDGELLHIGATHNFAPDALESFLRMYPRKPDRSQLAGRAILSRNIVHVHDVLVDPEYAHEVAVASNLRAMLSVPMFRDGKPVGVITVVRREAAPFSERQIELLKTFADQAVIAIGNVRLFEEVQARTAELQEALEQQTATSEVLQAISRSTFDLDAVLETLVQSAARLCEADISTITRQKDGVYYRGALTASRRISPRGYAASPSSSQEET
jgi:GAF domain-containing protein